MVGGGPRSPPSSRNNKGRKSVTLGNIWKVLEASGEVSFLPDAKGRQSWPSNFKVTHPDFATDFSFYARRECDQDAEDCVKSSSEDDMDASEDDCDEDEAMLECPTASDKLESEQSKVSRFRPWLVVIQNRELATLTRYSRVWRSTACG